MASIRGSESTALTIFAAVFLTLRRYIQFEGKYIMTVHDMDKARSTYDSFMGTLKWTVPLICALTFIVILLIAE